MGQRQPLNGLVALNVRDAILATVIASCRVTEASDLAGLRLMTAEVRGAINVGVVLGVFAEGTTATSVMGAIESAILDLGPSYVEANGYTDVIKRVGRLLAPSEVARG